MHDAVWIAFIVGLPAFITSATAAVLSLRNGWNVAKLRAEVNGRLTQLLNLAVLAARTEGVIAGHAGEQPAAAKQSVVAVVAPPIPGQQPPPPPLP